MDALPPLLSIAEVSALERAWSLGAPSLGTALTALRTRWAHHLRDDETVVRLLYLSWLGRIEPGWHTGIPADAPSAERYVDELGGDEALAPETMFVLAWLATRSPAALGDASRWEDRGEELFRRAYEREPRSMLFSSWSFFAGIDEDIRSHRKALHREVHARFTGRGVMGEQLRRALLERLRQIGWQPRL